MKYIKLYEAFESDTLLKILNFIKDKKIFLKELKEVLNSLDFPYSEITDDYFEYLPFDKALRKLDIRDNIPCPATSIEQFKNDGIEGEVCNNGKLKRKWGNTNRIIQCPNCKGTGEIPNKKGEIKQIKFWFDIDGKYITKTASDGLRRNSKKVDYISFDLEDYEIGEIIPKNKINQYNETPVYIESGQNKIVAFIHMDYGNIYAINKEIDGNKPYGRSTWIKKIILDGLKIFRIKPSEYSFPINRIRKLYKKRNIINPYEYNFNFFINSYGDIEIITTNYDSTDLLKLSNFALILDIDKLKKSEYKKLSSKKLDRAKSKENTLKLIKDEDIKKQNIERYFDKITNIDIISDINNANKLIKKSLGYKYTSYVLFKDYKQYLNNLIDIYYNILKNQNEDDFEKEILQSKQYIRLYITKVLDYCDVVKKSINYVEKIINKEEFQKIEDFNEVSEYIYNKIINYNIETIEDLEILKYKLMLITKILADNSSYSLYDELIKNGIVKKDYYILSLVKNIYIDKDRIKKLIDRL